MTTRRILFIDPFSGVSGDMFVGALLDLGADLARLHFELSKLKLSGYQLGAKKVLRGGLAATKFDVELGAGEHSHADEAGRVYTHSHGDGTAEHTHGRTHSEIKTIIVCSALSSRVKTSALATFQRLAEAEGKIHNVSPENVGFHEVGALDSIVDIVGACVCLEALGIDELRCGAVALGSGVVKCAHGLLPVPAPATLELMKGIPTRESPVEKELTTPTGAALVAALAVGFGMMPVMSIEAIGYGAGSRENPNVPNVLRAVLGSVTTTENVDAATSDTVLEIQANLDDETPEVLGYLSEKLFEAGALDVCMAPIQMKKSRPGTLLTVLADPAKLELMAGIIFTECPTFGLRYQTLSRLKLARRMVTVTTPFGNVRVKVGTWRGKEVSVHPEYDDCRVIAREKGVPLRVIIDAARNGFETAEGRG